jgi:hypothetical protein
MNPQLDKVAPVERVREMALVAYEPSDPLHRAEALFRSISDILTDAGHFVFPEWAPVTVKSGRKTVTIHGYEFNDEEETLTLIHLLDCHCDRELMQSWERTTCPSADIDRAFWDMEELLNLAKSDVLPVLDESDEGNRLFGYLKDFAIRNPARVSLSLWTTGDLSKEGWRRSDKSVFHTEVWDANRLGNAMDNDSEGLQVDFTPFGGISCLLADKDFNRLGKESGVVLIGKLPGECLAQLYFQYRTRLLQQNVRAFLSANNTVNKGILNTAKAEPHRFLAYNNGIAATASSIELERMSSGVYRLISAADFQIVNGGQTTATLMLAKHDKKHDADLSAIEVALKLTVVSEDDLLDLVPHISRCANLQSKVQESDFESNNPWLVKLEGFSRRIEATKDEQSQGQPIQWYFERVRGQYTVDVGKCQPGAQQKAFKARNPRRTKFTKTDLSIAALAWDQEPDLASLGPQKCFGRFAKRLAAAKDAAGEGAVLEPSEEDFRRPCCLMILRREGMAIWREVKTSPLLSSSCVTSYAMAYLAKVCKNRLPWAEIWNAQQLPPELSKSMRLLIRGCERAILTIAKQTNRRPDEFAKKAECWERVSQAAIDPDVSASSRAWDKFSLLDTVRPSELVQADELFFSLTSNQWLTIASEIEKVNKNAAYKGCADTMAKYVKLRKKPSPKQARILARTLLRLRKSKRCAFLEKLDKKAWHTFEAIGA